MAREISSCVRARLLARELQSRSSICIVEITRPTALPASNARTAMSMLCYAGRASPPFQLIFGGRLATLPSERQAEHRQSPARTSVRIGSSCPCCHFQHNSRRRHPSRVAAHASRNTVPHDPAARPIRPCSPLFLPPALFKIGCCTTRNSRMNGCDGWRREGCNAMSRASMSNPPRTVGKNDIRRPSHILPPPLTSPADTTGPSD